MHGHLNQDHWQYFEKCADLEQGPVGTVPASYALIGNLSSEKLSNHALSRNEVLGICQDGKTDEWLCFLTIMAWGAQDKMRGGPAKVKAMFEQRMLIVEKIHETKAAKSRAEAFDIWANHPVKHLGVAYFSKVLFFLLYPRLGVFIMDKWTSASFNLLRGEARVTSRHLWQRRYADEARNRYVEFCEFVEEIAQKLSVSKGKEVSSMEAEAALFSVGGRGARAGAWRAYVRERIEAAGF